MGEGFAGKVAVVTGAGSGIGRALSLELARHGARLALSDVDVIGLAGTAERAQSMGADVKSDRLDVTERDAFSDYADEVHAHFGAVHHIYNNAGIAFAGDIETSQVTDIERVMNVNFWGVVHGTKAFLPHIIASGDGHVVNISSLFGLFAAPGQAGYVAAKFAVRGFTEALRQEMVLAGHPVKVTAVHPGGVQTSLAHNASGTPGFDKAKSIEVFDKAAITSPEKAARAILRGVRKNKARVLVGPDAWAVDALVRLTGPGYQRLFTMYQSWRTGIRAQSGRGAEALVRT
jgi:short-subunit dehydrogenase